MNYRHAFHAGNHADVLKHVVLLALCDALVAKPTPVFALDTHAGRGLYALDSDAAVRTGEANEGIDPVLQARTDDDWIQRYALAVQACRDERGPTAYPGSPWLIAHALRDIDRVACCELQPEEVAALKSNLSGDRRIAVHHRDGYAALKALLPPVVGGQRYARGLVLVDPPYESQLDELGIALAALRDGLARWPQATYVLWYPIKQRRVLQPFYRDARALPAKSVMLAELLVRPDDSPLRMNGSGLLLLNAPYRFDVGLERTLPQLASILGTNTRDVRVERLAGD